MVLFNGGADRKKKARIRWDTGLFGTAGAVSR